MTSSVSGVRDSSSTSTVIFQVPSSDRSSAATFSALEPVVSRRLSHACRASRAGRDRGRDRREPRRSLCRLLSAIWVPPLLGESLALTVPSSSVAQTPAPARLCASHHYVDGEDRPPPPSGVVWRLPRASHAPQRRTRSRVAAPVVVRNRVT